MGIAELSSVVGETDFLLKILQTAGVAGLLFIIWFLQRKSEDKRWDMIIKAEDKKWTQKFNQEKEERDQQFQIFRAVMENTQANTGLLTSINTNLAHHPRMFEDMKDRLDQVSANLGVLHGRIDIALQTQAGTHLAPFPKFKEPA